ncbi:hypothetical protein [Streptomyces sp. NPDC048002]|uniref:hypothetical protein n=1 Tax=Streptomyces sp. NPDC048002 TaxID=3154344 RepID=UPI0033E3E0E8
MSGPNSKDGWEIEGVDKTLAFLRAKRIEAERIVQRTAVRLGLPHGRRRQG